MGGKSSPGRQEKSFNHQYRCEVQAAMAAAAAAAAPGGSSAPAKSSVSRDASADSSLHRRAKSSVSSSLSNLSGSDHQYSNGGVKKYENGSHHQNRQKNSFDEIYHDSSINESICDKVRHTCHAGIHHLKSQWKLLFMGQVLSFLLSATGASQATLFLDCHLSAPTFALGFYYFLLAQLLWIPLVYERITGRPCPMSKPIVPAATQGPSPLSNSSQSVLPSASALSFSTAASPEPTVYCPAPPEEDQPHSATTADAGTSHDNNETISPAGVGAAAASTAMPHSWLWGLIPLQAHPLTYLPMAILDVYANFCMVSAFKYTTITSVTLLDALAIPSAMILSSCALARKYSMLHFVGVGCCSIGILLNVFQDYEQDEKDAAGDGPTDDIVALDYPQKMRGDLLAICGGLLLGATNVAGETAVRHMGGPLEYLGMLGFFASILCMIQASFLERDEIAAFLGEDSAHSETCSVSTAWMLLASFSMSSTAFYIGTSKFLQVSEAAFFNLSLLTGDIWSVTFSVFEERIVPPPLFFYALIWTISGVIVYEMAPTPVVEDRESSNTAPECADSPDDDDDHEDSKNSSHNIDGGGGYKDGTHGSASSLNYSDGRRRENENSDHSVDKDEYSAVELT